MGDYLGPNYPYHKNIATPDDMGMAPKGDMDSLGKNIQGLVNYASLLMTGDTVGNKKILNEQANIGSQQPLGDRIFVKTMGKCKKKIWDGEPVAEKTDEEKKEETDEESKKKAKPTEKEELVERHVFVDHIPTGNIPGLGNISAMKGFVPGVMDNIFKLNPIKIINAMGAPAEPDCYEVTFETIKYDPEDNRTDKEKHEISEETHWVSIEDLKGLNPCTFKSGKFNKLPTISGKLVSQGLVGKKLQHPLNREDWPTGAYCHWMQSPEEGFANLFKMKNMNVKKSIINVKNKPIAKIFNASFGILLAYLLFKVLRKELN